MKKTTKLLIEKLLSAHSVAIVAHKNPDADALCSVLALSRLVKLNFGLDSVCLYDGNIPDALDNIPLRSKVEYFEHTNLSKVYDVVLLLDYGSERNIGGPMAIIEKAKYVIEIDHHENDKKIGALCIDDISAVATGEIIYELMMDAKWKKDEDVADLIALAILTDSGFLKFVQKGKVLRIMADLVDNDGINMRDLMSLLNNRPYKDVQTEARVASNAELLYNRRLALAVIDRHDYKNIDGRGEVVLNLLNQIKGVEYIVLLKEQKVNQIGVSLRSKTRPINDIAVSLGGGGHAYAAGAVVHDTLENVRKQVLNLFKKV